MWESKDKNIIEYNSIEMSNSDYHSAKNSNFLSSSDVKVLLESPLHFQQYLKEKSEEKESKETLIIGSHFHSNMSIEIMKYNSNNDYQKLSEKVLVMEHCGFPINDKTGKPYGINTITVDKWIYGKDFKKEDLISFEDKQMIDTMRNNLLSNKEIKRFVFNSQTEISIFVKNFFVGYNEENKPIYVSVKIRPDFFNFNLKEEKLIIGDWKTCKKGEAKKDKFSRVIVERNYHISVALYINVMKVYIKEKYDIELNDKQILFFLIPIEKEEPYDFSFYAVDLNTIAVGKNEYEYAFKEYVKATEKNEWSGYEKNINSFISLPKWYQPKFKTELNDYRDDFDYSIIN